MSSEGSPAPALPELQPGVLYVLVAFASESDRMTALRGLEDMLEMGEIEEAFEVTSLDSANTR